MLKNSFWAVVISFFLITAVSADEIGTTLTGELDGTLLGWEYKGGRNYELKMDGGMVTYRRTNGTEAREWRSVVPYLAHKVHEGEYMIGWHEKDISNYVTLFINLNDSKLYSSALLDDYDLIHFQEARITGVTRK